ncbi:MAG TPA: DedA family protein [Candidatus Nanoarchaeia archaeon]|nr:DedA family protein [Candidatus Nanoarchaeia archaeon]
MSLNSVLISMFQAFLDNLNYYTVFLLMAVESSIIPLPSEIVIPPAAYLASKSGFYAVFLVVIAGTLGSLLGASIMYVLSRTIGRSILLNYGKYVLIPKSKIIKSEIWFKEYGSFGVFLSRLVPVIRHLIGIPAGIAKMNYIKFAIYTLLGSFIWCSILAFVGIKAGNNEALMAGSLHAITIWSLGTVLVLGAMYYFFFHRHFNKKK